MRPTTLLALALSLLPAAALAQAPGDAALEAAIDSELAAVRTHLDYLDQIPMARDEMQAKARLACMRALTGASQDFAKRVEETDVSLAAELAERGTEHLDFDACLKRANITVPHASPNAK